MNNRELSNKLLRSLVEYQGVNPVELSAGDLALLPLGGHDFIFVYSEESEELLSLTRIAQLPEEGDRREEALRSLMAGNEAWAGTGGGYVGRDEGGWVCLSRVYRPDQEKQGDFLEKVARQVGLADYWLNVLTAEAPAAAPLDGPPMLRV